MYRIRLDDNSFFIVNEDFEITIFWIFLKTRVTIKKYLSNAIYKQYYMIDNINGEKIKRYFVVEPFENKEGFPLNIRLKEAQDIRVGDYLVGSDGTPNMVTEIHSGEEEMYDLTIEDETFTVNGSHILTLRDKDTNEVLDMPVNVYLEMPQEFKDKVVMVKGETNVES